MKRLLIRADDLGFSEAVNYGIEKSVKQGIIKSVGVMVNMDATLHGLRLLSGCDVCLGLHTNICAGRPLTAPNKISSLIGESGEFKASREYRTAKEDFVDLEEVVIEIEAQYEKFKELTGQEPHYFEGHAVASVNFFKGLETVADRHNLPLLKFSFDGNPIDFRGTKLHMHMDSMKPDYDPMRSLMNIDFHVDDVEMFICHPGYLDDYILTHSSLTIPRTKEVEMVCSKQVKNWISENNIQLVTYDDL